jgi:hypothetical protein
MTLSQKGLFGTLSKNDTQHINIMMHWVTSCWVFVVFHLILCWVSLCWVSWRLLKVSREPNMTAHIPNINTKSPRFEFTIPNAIHFLVKFTIWHIKLARLSLANMFTLVKYLLKRESNVECSTWSKLQACIIKPFQLLGTLVCLSLSATFTMTCTLAYFATELITKVKSFILQALRMLDMCVCVWRGQAHWQDKISFIRPTMGQCFKDIYLRNCHRAVPTKPGRACVVASFNRACFLHYPTRDTLVKIFIE